MKRNVGTMDRVTRAVAGMVMLTCSVMAPLSAAVRLGVFATIGGYLLLTAIVGSCLGYRLMGRSTCALEPPRAVS